jgi:HEAT repeat protein/lysophospholipase L1-like esterase
LGEAWARVSERPRAAPPLADTHGLDWQAEWSGDFYVMKSSSVGWPPWQDFNHDGMRDRCHPREKVAGTYRVACLGDSVTFGYGYARELAWPQQLERRSATRGPGVEVFNVALIGWSTRQERYAYERLVRGYRPDSVVLGICLNDIEDLQNNLSRPPPILAKLFQRSALVRRVIDAQGREIASIEELFSMADSAKVRRGYARLFEEIRSLRDEVRADGADFTLVIFPDADQVGSDPPPASPQERLAEFSRAEGVRLVDPLPQLRALGPSAFIDRVHFTPLGSAAVAKAVHASGAVPASASSAAALEAALVEADTGEGTGLRSPETVPVARLSGLLGHPEMMVRREAAWALGCRGSGAASAAMPLAQALRDPEPLVRQEAARALGLAGCPPSARPALFDALKDDVTAVRWAAADALGRLEEPDPDSIDALESATKSADAYVRGLAAWLLGRSSAAATRAVPVLRARLSDSEVGVRTLAVRALGNAAPTDAAVPTALIEALTGGVDEERWRAARALGKLGPAAAPAVGALSRMVVEGDEKLRREAALALGRIGPGAERALPALVAAERDGVVPVREAAEKAIRQITRHSQ